MLNSLSFSGRCSNSYQLADHWYWCCAAQEKSRCNLAQRLAGELVHLIWVLGPLTTLLNPDEIESGKFS